MGGREMTQSFDPIFPLNLWTWSADQFVSEEYCEDTQHSIWNKRALKPLSICVIAMTYLYF